MKLYSEIIFPKLYDFILGTGVFDNYRKKVLKSASGKILEIGIGTGKNLEFYPDNINELWAIDPSPGMLKQLNKKLEKQKIKVHFEQTGAENLPYENEQFDTVVSTITLCSIPELSKALSEIKRVLKQDGHFFFGSWIKQ
ncbi:MAG: class I SAM-dependent methyltransferase [Bacteriovoracaceae bacterium]|jgi:ubiquinone/menaquinone biosynthesis C-methylase UbiE|nr:class I SAM-dependent methyltransferase [Bacteriovoracaceae bacterium]